MCVNVIISDLTSNFSCSKYEASLKEARVQEQEQEKLTRWLEIISDRNLTLCREFKASLNNARDREQKQEILLR